MIFGKIDGNFFTMVKKYIFHSEKFALVDKKGYIRCRNDQFGNPKIYYKGSVNFQEKF